MSSEETQTGMRKVIAGVEQLNMASLEFSDQKNFLAGYKRVNWEGERDLRKRLDSTVQIDAFSLGCGGSRWSDFGISQECPQ